MRFSIVSVTTTLLAVSTAATVPAKHHAVRNLDLSKIPILSLVSALADSLPLDVQSQILPADTLGISKANPENVLSCILDALHLDAGVTTLTPSSAMPSSTASPTSSPSPASTSSSTSSTLEFSEISALDIVSAILHKLPVDVSGLSDLSKMDIQSIVSCVVESL